MGVKQFFIGRSTPSTVAAYTTPHAQGEAGWGGTENEKAAPWLLHGDFRNLRVVLSVAPGSGRTRTLTLRVNGVDTALTVTLADSDTEAISTAIVPVQPGDILSLSHTPTGSPVSANIRFTIEFNGRDAGESGYGWNGVVSSNASRAPALGSGGNSGGWYGPSTDNNSSLVSIDCALVETRIDLTVAPGAGASRTFTVRKNGVLQDGSGGTPDTRVTISDSNTTGSATFTLDLAPGDRVRIEHTVSGSPADSFAAGATRVVADTDHEWNLASFSTGNLPNGGPLDRWAPLVAASINWAQPEAFTNQNIAPASTFQLTHLRIWSNDNITGTFSARKNSGPGGPSVVLSGASSGVDATHSMTFGLGDTLGMEALGYNGFNDFAIWGARIVGVSEFEGADPSGQLLTQFVVQVATDEDLELDPPEPVAECVGGGTVATADAPATGTSLETATAPLAWMEVTIGATTYRWAKVAINHGDPKEARVLDFGVAELALSDRDGGPEASTISTRLADIDGLIRGLWTSGTLRHAAVDYYVADLATLRSGGAPWRVFRGFVSECRPEGDRTFRLVVDDVLTTRCNATDGQDLEMPAVRLTDQLGALTIEDRMWDLPAPHIYGAVSEEGGAWQCEYVGTAVAPGFESLGALFWFLVSIGVTRPQEVYLAGLGASPTIRIQLSETAFGSNVFVNTKTGWIEANAWSDRDGRRWTLIGGRPASPAVRLAKEHRIPMVINVCGYDEVGDATGLTIDNPARALEHFINNYVLQDATEDWLSLATEGGIALFDSESFEAVATLTEALGYKIAGVIGGDFRQASYRDRIAEFCRNFGFEVGGNRHGQIVLTMLDREDAAAGAPVVDETFILERSVSLDLHEGDVENEVRYVYRRHYLSTLPQLTPQPDTRLPLDPYAAAWRSGLQAVRNEGSITALGGGRKGLRRSPVLEFDLVRDSYTADAVASERLALYSPPNGRVEATFSVRITTGSAWTLGRILQVQHWDLPWTGTRRCQVRRLATSLDAMTVTVTVRDVDDLLP